MWRPGSVCPTSPTATGQSLCWWIHSPMWPTPTSVSLHSPISQFPNFQASSTLHRSSRGSCLRPTPPGAGSSPPGEHLRRPWKIVDATFLLPICIYVIFSVEGTCPSPV